MLKPPKYPDGCQEPREGAEDTQAPGARGLRPGYHSGLSAHQPSPEGLCLAAQGWGQDRGASRSETQRSPSSEEKAGFLFVFLINLVIYLFLAALGLRSCAQVFSSCGEQGLLFVAVRRLLIAVASPVAEHRL